MVVMEIGEEEVILVLDLLFLLAVEVEVIGLLTLNPHTLLVVVSLDKTEVQVAELVFGPTLVVEVELIDAVEDLLVLLEDLAVEEEVVLDQDQLQVLKDQVFQVQLTLVAVEVEVKH